MSLNEWQWDNHSDYESKGFFGLDNIGINR